MLKNIPILCALLMIFVKEGSHGKEFNVSSLTSCSSLVHSDAAGLQVVDLFPLKNETFNTTGSTGHDIHEYSYSPCSSNSSTCGSNSSTCGNVFLCQTDLHYDIGSNSDFGHNGTNIVIHYRSSCENEDGKVRNSSVTLVCDVSVQTGDFNFISETPILHYIFELHTKYACPQDYDECATDNGGCSQKCNNTDGSFRCYCDDGYSLDDDGTSCNVAINSTLANATVTIFDDDIVEIGFNQSSYQNTEMAGSVAVCAKLISGELGVDVTVDVSTTDGTAVSPDDYTALVSQQLTFISGQSSSGDNTQCFDVDIVADNIYEGLEMFTVQLFSRITTVTIAAASQSATVDIEDSTIVEVGFAQSSYTTSEGDGSVQVCVVLLSGALIADVTVGVFTNDGSAMSPDDYTSLQTKKLTFTSGQSSTGDNTQCFDIAINNGKQDGSKSFTVHLVDPLQPSPVKFRPSSMSTTVVIEDHPANELKVGLVAASEFTEADDSEVVCVQIMSGTVGLEGVNISMQASGGTATKSGEYKDYSLINDTLTFTVGQTVGDKQCSQLLVLDDDFVESNETIEISITAAASSYNSTDLNPQSIVSTILEDPKDKIQVFVLTNEIPVDWNETRNVSVCASRSPNRLEKDIVVQLAIRDVNTISGLDYVGFEPVAHTFSTEVYVVCQNITILKEESLLANPKRLDFILISDDPAVVINSSSSVTEIVIANVNGTVHERDEKVLRETTTAVTVVICLIGLGALISIIIVICFMRSTEPSEFYEESDGEEEMEKNPEDETKAKKREVKEDGCKESSKEKVAPMHRDTFVRQRSISFADEIKNADDVAAITFSDDDPETHITKIVPLSS